MMVLFTKPRHVLGVANVFIESDRRGITLRIIDGTRTLATEIWRGDVTTFLIAVAEVALPLVADRLKDVEEELRRWEKNRARIVEALKREERRYFKEQLAEAEEKIALWKERVEKHRALKKCLETILSLAE